MMGRAPATIARQAKTSSRRREIQATISMAAASITIVAPVKVTVV